MVLVKNMLPHSSVPNALLESCTDTSDEDFRDFLFKIHHYADEKKMWLRAGGWLF